MTPNSNTTAHESEILSVSAGKMDGKTVLVLTVRLTPAETHAVTNIAVSGKQARRLLGDLKYLFHNSELLKAVPELNPDEELLPEAPPEPPKKRTTKKK